MLWTPEGSRPEIQTATCQAPGGVDDTAVNSSFYAQGLPRWGVASDEAGGSFEVEKEKAIHIHIHPYPSIGARWLEMPEVLHSFVFNRFEQGSVVSVISENSTRQKTSAWST